MVWGQPIRDRTRDQNGGPDFPFDPEPFLALPPPPVDVRVRLISATTLQVDWKDIKYINKFKTVDYWAVIIADDSSISGSSGDAGFADKVIRFGISVDTQSSAGDGRQYSFQSSSTVLVKGWVCVVGFDLTGTMGKPSTPYHFDMSGNNTKTAPPDGSGFSLNYNVGRINNVDTFNLTFSAIPPADRSLFGGWHVHLTGYNALTQYTEIGSLQNPSSDSSTSTWTVRLPMEGGQGNGVATFSGTGVTKVSGDNFNAAWIGHLIYVRDVTTGTTGLTTVAGVSSATAMTTGAALTAGTWTYRVLNALSFRLVSVSTNGSRDPNPAHAGVPTLNL